MHCAALVITENIISSGYSPNPWSLVQPSEELRSGTITFVKYNNKVYGIIYWHVIEIYRGLIKESGNIFSHT